MQEIFSVLREIKPALKVEFKVNEIGIFGSVARGDQKAASDIDFLVDLDYGADLVDLIGLSQFLEERLRQRCDVVPRNALRPELRERILREVRYP